MKNFITSMLGAFVALLVFAAGAALLFVGFIGAIIALGQQHKAPEIEAGSYLVFDLSTNITDAPRPVDLGSLANVDNDTLQLRSILKALKAAEHDKRIAGVLLLGNLSPNGLGTGYAALREVRGALSQFRASGKPVVAFIDFASTKDYYLASVASDLVLDPYGELLMPGLSVEPWFLAGAFEKYGIGIQVARAGKYKNYAETYTRSAMSPESREEMQTLLDSVWGTLVSDIGKSRSLTPEALQETVDQQGIISARAALKAHLCDRTAYRDEVIAKLKNETGVTSPTESFKQVDLAQYARIALPARTPSMSSGDVAVLYAEGDIVEGEGDQNEIGGTRFAREIRKLRQDPDVKAIVLRVNSPGGTTTASETIQRELRLAREVKPVVVSMGSYAASGGYWISAYGSRIFAEPTTITGSIGVFGILPNIQKLANDHGVTFDSVKTGRFADVVTISRPKTDAEMALFQDQVDWTYGQFVAKVAEGRKLPVSRVESIAQGRVWSGTEAKKIGLVDEIGGLQDAIRYAGEEAHLGAHFRVEEYPRPKNLSEAIAEMIGRFGPTSIHVQTTGLLGEVAERVNRELSWLKGLNDPRGVYARLPADLVIR
jgi:protease-4